jgi:hypothetical protein
MDSAVYYAKYHTLIFMTPGLLGLLGLLPSQVKRVYLSHSLTHSEDPHSLTQSFSHRTLSFRPTTRIACWLECTPALRSSCSKRSRSFSVSSAAAAAAATVSEVAAAEAAAPSAARAFVLLSLLLLALLRLEPLLALPAVFLPRFDLLLLVLGLPSLLLPRLLF